MHELSITQELVKVVDESRRKYGEGCRVIKISVRLGKLNGIEPRCVEAYYELITENTPLHGAKLEFIIEPVKIKCKSCDKDFEIDSPLFLCPSCNKFDIEVVSGRELFIDSIEIEEPAEQRDERKKV